MDQPKPKQIEIDIASLDDHDREDVLSDINAENIIRSFMAAKAIGPRFAFTVLYLTILKVIIHLQEIGFERFLSGAKFECKVGPQCPCQSERDVLVKFLREMHRLWMASRTKAKDLSKHSRS